MESKGLELDDTYGPFQPIPFYDSLIQRYRLLWCSCIFISDGCAHSYNSGQLATHLKQVIIYCQLVQNSSPKYAVSTKYGMENFSLKSWGT